MPSTRRALLTALGTGAVAASSGCLSLLDDRRAWRYSTDGNWVPYPVVHDGRVYVGATAGPFRALDAADGALHWTFETEAPASTRPAADADTVYVGDETGLLALER